MSNAAFWKELWHDRDPIVYRQGGCRTCPAEATLDRIHPLLSRAGIVRVTELTGLDRVGIPVAMAVRPDGWIESASYGKGATRVQAIVGAAMECLERWHAEHVMLSPMQCPYGQIEQRLGYDLFQLTVADPCLITESTPIDWLPAIIARSGEPTYIPAELAHLDFRTDRRLDLPRFRPNTNGLASANTVQEAFLHALCELVERDALARHHNGSSREKIVRLESIPPGEVQHLVARFQEQNFVVRLSELPSPTGLPTMMAQVWCPEDQSLFMGSGSHLDRNIAAVRALTEVAQTRLCRKVGLGESLNPEDDLRWPYPPETSDLEMVNWQQTPHVECNLSLAQLTALVLDRIEQYTGQSVIATDLRHSQMNQLPVVFAFAPGMLYVEA